MNSHENALAENAGASENGLKENLKQRELELKSATIKSLDCLIYRSRFIQRHANTISASSTELFIKSFLSDINEIRTDYKSIKSYFEVIAELYKISIEKNKNNNSPVKRDSEKEEENDEKNKIKNIPEIMDIKSELEKITIEIISKSGDAKNHLRNMNGINNDDSFIAMAYNSFKDLNDAILKMDSIEKTIMEYSG